MADDTTLAELQQQLRELDAEIAQLRGISGNAESGGDVRDSEEIASDLTSREEQDAVLGILEQRREAIRERLKRAGDQ